MNTEQNKDAKDREKDNDRIETRNYVPGKNEAERKRQEDLETNRKRRKEGKLDDEEIDDELDQTFPASDPPSYSKPGNDRKGD